MWETRTRRLKYQALTPTFLSKHKDLQFFYLISVKSHKKKKRAFPYRYLLKVETERTLIHIYGRQGWDKT